MFKYKEYYSSEQLVMSLKS